MKGRTINPDKKIGTALTLSRETIEIIDRERGQSSRSSFIDNWILSAFGGENRMTLTPSRQAANEKQS
jgi:hypothetical protein